MSKSSSLKIVAKKLSVPEIWLDKLIQFESGWNPKAINKISGAMGLIQFTNKTAQSMGFSDAKSLVSKYPDIDSQMLNAVLPYLIKMVPFYTPQSLYMSVFYPAARNWSNLTVFPKWVTDSNPGIVTVSDYVSKVDKIKKTPLVMIAMAFLGVLIFYINRKR